MCRRGGGGDTHWGGSPSLRRKEGRIGDLCEGMLEGEWGLRLGGKTNQSMDK